MRLGAPEVHKMRALRIIWLTISVKLEEKYCVGQGGQREQASKRVSELQPSKLVIKQPEVWNF